MRGGNNDAGCSKYQQSCQADSVPPEAVHDAADKKLREAITDQKKRERQLHLDAADVQVCAHGRQGRDVDVRGETGKRYQGKCKDVAYAVVFLFDHFWYYPTVFFWDDVFVRDKNNYFCGH